jgi:hypothetical protein
VSRLIRFRIRDLMVLNGVVALVLGAGIFLGSFVLVGFLAGMVGIFVVLPIVLVEVYLYGHRQGTVYRWRHPVPRRPRFVPPVVPLAARRMGNMPGAVEPLAERRPRTRLFESAEPSGMVSRASLLFDVAAKLESEGKAIAAEQVYQQVVDRFADSHQAREARQRLQAIAGLHPRPVAPEEAGA